ncbi:MAG: hypothetical protein IPI64_06860 [Chloracidobacterium sp.]|nr:hypothetical protein [Chloracidobacterium sp.]
MKPIRRESDHPVKPRVTPEPFVIPDHLDEELFDKTGEQWYFETIEQTEYGVDPFGEGLTPDAYWAEGWNLSYYQADRSNACGHDDALHRMFPTRYRLADFDLSRSFRRVLKNNADLECVVRPFRPTPAKDELDQIHCYSRFRETKAPLSTIYAKLRYRPAPIRELTVFHPTRGLIAFTLIEVGENASYALRTAWNPDERKRSLGTFTFLKAVEYARSLGFEHHYVGPTLLADPAFSYKLRFPACELYDWDANDWVASESERAKAMFAAPFPRRRWDTETEDWAK